jgi:hypothetical protein
MKQLEQKIRLKKDLIKEIEDKQLRLYGHFMRMEDCKIARQVAE